MGLWLYYCRVMMLLPSLPHPSHKLSLCCKPTLLLGVFWHTLTNKVWIVVCAHTFSHVFTHYKFWVSFHCIHKSMRACAWWCIGVCPPTPHKPHEGTPCGENHLQIIYGANETFQYPWRDYLIGRYMWMIK
jgi:hypothetical protein